MIPNSNRLLFSLLLILLITGLSAGIAGVYLIGNEEDTLNQTEESWQYPPILDNTVNSLASVSTKRTMDGAPVLTNQVQMPDTPAHEMGSAERGITVGELMRIFGIISIVVAIGILLWIEFINKEKMTRQNYRLLLIISLFVLPVLIGLSTTTTVLETTKTVQSCASCHVMDPFVNDLIDESSTSLAARHYKNGWIAEYQCYTCHTTYGAHGTFEGKRDGFRHWLLYVTRAWEDPIQYAGSYPNMNCTACHGGTTAFMDVPSHTALMHEFRTDEVSCTSCHGPAHPVPSEREQTAGVDVGGMKNINSNTISLINEHELEMIMENMHVTD